MQKAFWGLLLASVSAAALSQETFYYCSKNGEMLISDRPCMEGAREVKRVDAEDLPPLNTSQVLTPEERLRAVRNWEERKEAERRQEEEEQLRQRAEEKLQLQAQEKQQRCDKLTRWRHSLLAQQRKRDGALVSNLIVKANIELQKLGCEF